MNLCTQTGTDWHAPARRKPSRSANGGPTRLACSSRHSPRPLPRSAGDRPSGGRHAFDTLSWIHAGFLRETRSHLSLTGQLDFCTYSQIAISQRTSQSHPPSTTFLGPDDLCGVAGEKHVCSRLARHPSRCLGRRPTGAELPLSDQKDVLRLSRVPRQKPLSLLSALACGNLKRDRRAAQESFSLLFACRTKLSLV